MVPDASPAMVYIVSGIVLLIMLMMLLIILLAFGSALMQALVGFLQNVQAVFAAMQPPKPQQPTHPPIYQYTPPQETGNYQGVEREKPYDQY